MVKVLSCNIRYFGADDGENNWVHRRDVCAAVMREQRPDIIGVQEMWREQFVDLQERLPNFASYGLMHEATSRHPANCIFYDAARFELVTAAGYWLSETPHIPGSKSWGSHGERLANWVRLIDKSDGREFRVINTHLDHISGEARLAGAKLICGESGVYPADYPQILIGDMNANERSEPIAQFMQEGWRDAHAQVEVGRTFHGFKGDDFSADYGQIDWIFVRGGVVVREVAVIRAQRDGRFPSDHYFMAAEVALT